ncbi:aldo/keto reductase, putative [Ricinus communis]|uniref:Aldo/keto reductase, putative n=1 Tax=Ricinus communis TaxID=3988 RepID=B9RR49_RICCO|nr:aldo/keto reductase, putative [Ricinus communis]
MTTIVLRTKRTSTRSRKSNSKSQTSKPGVSKLGFECTVLSGLYNYPLTDEEEIPIIMHAFSKVITFFDTTNIYGENANESLVGKALKQLPRDKIQVATKFGMLKIGPDGLVVCGRPKYVGESSEASLKRLDVQYIDLYYQHLLRTRSFGNNIEGSCSAPMLYKWNGPHGLAYKGRDSPPLQVIVSCFLSHTLPAKGSWNDFGTDKPSTIKTFRINFYSNCQAEHPSFTDENLKTNKILYEQVVKVGRKVRLYLLSVSSRIAWILCQCIDAVPIPEDLKEIAETVNDNEVAVITRTYAYILFYSWRFATTPTKEGTACHQNL